MYFLPYQCFVQNLGMTYSPPSALNPALICMFLKLHFYFLLTFWANFNFKVLTVPFPTSIHWHPVFSWNYKYGTRSKLIACASPSFFCGGVNFWSACHSRMLQIFGFGPFRVGVDFGRGQVRWEECCENCPAEDGEG